jgi:uncharacterized protein (TIGR00369 family)
MTEVSADLVDRLRARFQRSPLLSLINFEVVSVAWGEAVLGADFRPEYDNGGGAIHGGILSMLADTAVACALSTHFDGRMGFATANLNIHFLRRARSRVTATAKIIKRGATVCVGQVEIVDGEGELVASAISDFVLTTARATPGAVEG